MGGLTWWARAQWLQNQRPMWREHDAKLASVWRRDESGEQEVDTVIVLPANVDSVARIR